MNAGLFYSDDGSTDLSGLTGGLRGGYNVQAGTMVFGLEGAINLTDLSVTDSYYGSDQGPLFESETRVDSYGTLTARAGVALDNVLLYALGGVAFGSGKASLDVTGGPPDDPQETYSASDRNLHVGYVLGGGLEMALDDNWSIGGEYQYVNLGSADYRFEFPDSDGSYATSTGDVAFHALKLGVNYRF